MRGSELDYDPPRTGSDEDRDFAGEAIARASLEMADEDRFPSGPHYTYLDGKKVEYMGPEWRAHLDEVSTEYGKQGAESLAHALGRHSSERIVSEPLPVRTLVMAGGTHATPKSHPKAA